MSLSERVTDTSRGFWFTRFGVFQMAGIDGGPVIASALAIFSADVDASVSKCWLRVVSLRPFIRATKCKRPEARWGQRSRRHMQIGLRYTSGIGGVESDMFLGVITKTAWHAVGSQIAALSAFIGKSFSDKGSVTLASADWRKQPQVDFRLLADYRDTTRLMDGFRRLVMWQTMPELRAVTREIMTAEKVAEAIVTSS